MGQAFIVESKEEKIIALRGLMEKYQPEGGYGEFTDKEVEKTAVVKIVIEKMTAKENG
ncbi:MAG: pyridoxamine 5'-phosphate oxidase family protein [Nitrospinae bacterium]|nr:pyridoxamine 5'-phosphate oxidase family protein [Nitrospinota bacterium]